MKRILKAALAVLILSALPLKGQAQQPRQIKVSEFSIHDIRSIEERTFLIHTILEQGYFCYKNENLPDVVDVYVSSDASDELSDFDFFYDNLLFEQRNEFSYFDKDLRGELFLQWRQELDDELFKMLYEDFTRGIASDNATCETAFPFCTDNGAYNFPAGVNSGSPCGEYYNASCSDPYACSGTQGQSSNCLSTAPNPAFYYMRIDEPGNLNIYMYSTPQVDIDFDCWGPFDDINTACDMLSCSNIVDCSYSTAATEHCHINNAQHGQYYILLITNYSNDPCNINFENIGTGTTDCGILPPLVNNDGPYCEGQTIHLTAHGQPGTTFSWVGPNNFTSNEQNPTIPNCTMAMAGRYTCTITLGSQTSDATTEVHIYQQPTPSFTSNTVCQGQATQFNGIATGSNVANYEWDFGDGETGSGQDVSHTYSQAGSYQVTLTVSAEDGSCPGEITQTAVVYAQPVANPGPDQTIGYGSSAQLSGSGGSGNFTYHWEPANMVLDPDAQNTQTVVLITDQTYTLTVTNPQGQCTDMNEVTIHIDGGAMTLAVYASPNSFCQGESTQLTATAGSGTGNYTYSWSPTTGLSNPNIYNPVATPTQTTTYSCTVNDGQTTQTLSTMVTVYMPDYLPNVTISGQCDIVPISWQGQSVVFHGDTTYKFIGETEEGCYREQTYIIEGMMYTPEPEIKCTNEDVELPHHPITATEFNVNCYTYHAIDPQSDITWIKEQCEWNITKDSWRIVPSDDNLSCDVYAMDWVEDTVWLSFKAVSTCSEEGVLTKYWLKPSFYGIEDQEAYLTSVSITPNPNNGQMQLHFENMEGDISVKIYTVAGLMVDSFELQDIQTGDSVEYTMKRLQNGVYFFAISNGKRTITKKIVIIH